MGFLGGLAFIACALLAVFALLLLATAENGDDTAVRGGIGFAILAFLAFEVGKYLWS